jgi:hypothetical protein
MAGFYRDEFVKVSHRGDSFIRCHLNRVLLLPGVEATEGIAAGGKALFISLGFHSGHINFILAKRNKILNKNGGSGVVKNGGRC